MARQYVKLKKKKPLIIICSQGQGRNAEKCYFGNFSNRNLRIKFSTGGSTDPEGMVDDLITFMHNEDAKSEDYLRVFLVLDTDLSEKRINEIKQIEQRCKENNIEIITSAPTFEIWYLMHYRKSKLRFTTSKDVKRELEKVNGTYSETMDMYNKIKNQTDDARSTAQSIEQQIIKDGEDLLKSNPHSSVYKILDAIDEFNNLKD